MASLLAKVCVPEGAGNNDVQKVILTDRYLIAGTLDGWITVLDVREAHRAEETDAVQYQRTLSADAWCDLDCRGDLIATANSNGNVTLWDARTVTRTLDLVGHEGCAKIVRLPANREDVISGGTDKTIIIWDAVSGRRRSILTGHSGRIKGLKVFGKMLVSSCTKGWVIVWDLDTGSCVHSCQGVGPVVDVALNYNHTLLAIGFRGGCIDVGDIEKGRDAWKTFVGNTHVMFELSNQSENVLTSSSADGITRSWSWTSGDLLTVRDNFDIVVPNCRVVWVESVMKEAVKRCDAEALAFWHQLHSRGCNIVNVAKRGDVVAIATLFHDKSPTIELWDLTELEARKVRRGRGRMLPIAFR